MQVASYDLYSVESTDGILGNSYALEKMRNFCKDTNAGLRRAPLLIYGPSGVGKSASVHLLAMENGWNVVELNASDYRNKETIERKLLTASTSRSLMGGRNLILLDEIDEIAARFDKGAGSAISELMGKSKSPIIFIANNMWDQSITFLRNKTEPVEFRKLDNDTVHRVLTNLCRRFSIKVNKESLQIIANRSNGDARSAINDMSVVIGREDEELTEVIGLRDRKVDIFNTLDRIFLTGRISTSLRAIRNIDLDNDMLMKWIDENIPRRYSYGVELSNAFDSLSRASIFASRAVKSQYYTYWRYMNVFMSGGVALSKTHYPVQSRGYAFPKVIKELSGSKSARRQDRGIAEKLQRVFHSSIRSIVRNEMAMISRSAKKSIRTDKDSKGEIVDYLASTYLLEGKEVEYLLGRGS